MLRLDHILVAYDYSDSAEKALIRAMRLAKQFGATLHVLYAEVLFTTSPVEDEDHSTESARHHLQKTVAGVAGRIGISLDAVQTTYAIERDVAPAPAILRYAEDHPADLVVIGTHGRRGVRRLLLGSVAEEVVRQAPCPVLTVHGEQEVQERPIRSILVPIDFSKYAREALHVAKELAATLGARVDLLHVIQEQMHPAFYNTGVFSVYDVEPDLDEKARLHLRQFYAATPGPDAPAGEPRVEAIAGYPSHEIVAYADEHDIDLIVMATHGRTGLDRFLMGSVAERVARRASCSVFAVKSFGRSLIDPAAARDAAVTS